MGVFGLKAISQKVFIVICWNSTIICRNIFCNRWYP